MAFGAAGAGTFGTTGGAITGRVKKLIVTSTLDNPVAVSFAVSGSVDDLIVKNGTGIGSLVIDYGSDLQASFPAFRLRHLGAAPTAGSIYFTAITSS